PLGSRPPVDRGLGRRRWGAEEERSSPWSEGVDSSGRSRIGTGKAASPVRVITTSADVADAVPTPNGLVRRGGESPGPLADSEESMPIPVSLSGVVLASVAGLLLRGPRATSRSFVDPLMAILDGARGGLGIRTEPGRGRGRGRLGLIESVGAALRLRRE